MNVLTYERYLCCLQWFEIDEIDESCEGPPKTAVVPENTDAVRELIMQDRHVA